MEDNKTHIFNTSVDAKLADQHRGLPKNDDTPPNDTEPQALPAAAKAVDDSETPGTTTEEVGTPEHEKKASASQSKDPAVDDFGNPVAPTKRTYTEEEVNAMMRDRAKRGRFRDEPALATQPAQQPQQQNSEEISSSHVDPQASGDWQQELEGFVKQTLQKVSQEQQHKERQELEQRMQLEFEDKFGRGMQRYADFADVVKDKPIDNDMLLSTRSMQDPAAFIYAAAKTYPKELSRIAELRDPYTKALEMGRLEERMRKVRAGTAAPRPLNSVAGDVANTGGYTKQSVDEKLRATEQRRLKGYIRRF